MSNQPRNPSKTGKSGKTSRGQQVEVRPGGTVLVRTPEGEEGTVAGDEGTGEAPQPQEPQDDLSSLLGQGFVRVSRVKPNGEVSFLRKIDRSVLGEDIGFIGQTWGGGRYFLEVFNEKKHWVRRFHMSFDESEYGPAKFAHPVEPGEDPGEAGEVSPSPYGYPQMGYQPPSSRDIEEKVRERLEEQRLQFERERERDRAHALEIKQMHDSQITLLTSTMKEIARPQDNPILTMENLMQMSDRMLQVRPGPQDSPANNPLNNLLTKAAERLLERGLEDSGGSGGEGGSLIERLGTKLIDILGPTVARAVAAGYAFPPKGPAMPVKREVTGSPPPTSLASSPKTSPLTPPTSSDPADAGDVPVVLDRPALPQDPPAPQGGNGEAPSQEEPIVLQETPLMKEIKTHALYRENVPVLLDLARSKTPPQFVAEEIDKRIPDEHFGILEALVNHEDLVTYLSSFEPEVMQHGDWIIAVRDRLKAIVDEQIKEMQGSPPSGEEPANV